MRSTRPTVVATAVTIGVLFGAITPDVTRAQAPGARVGPAVRTLAFTDSTSVRLEVRVRGGAGAAGASARATLRAVDGAVVFTGVLGTATAEGADAVVRGRLTNLAVRPWSPAAPVRYTVTVEMTSSGGTVRDSARIGFRTVRAEGGRILLNGRPLFLRGNAINPPGRNLPDSLNANPGFAREYLRTLKRAGVNIIRLGSISEVWMDAADDVGMLLFQGHYGVPKGGTATRAPTDMAASLAWYRNDVLAQQVNHPSVIIYALSNETADAEVHYQSDGAAGMGRFLQTVYDSVHAWDPTRLVIANAGYGFGRTGEICDMHRYWGWYYNSFLSFYTLRDPAVCWRGRTGQPITMSENTGNYTGADGRFNLVSDTKQPDSQLNWTGHAPDSEQRARALTYQAWLAGQAIEITRRLRAQNPNLAGTSPFTIVFSKWHGITSVADMQAKPVVAQYARSFAPVLLSWETWTPQLYAGATFTPVAHVVNDADNGAAVRGATVHARLRAPDGTTVAQARLTWPKVPYYGAVSRPLPITVPLSASAGRYTLEGLVVRGADTIARNSSAVHVYAPMRARTVSPRAPLARTLRVYDPSGRTRAALTAHGYTTSAVTTVVGLQPATDALIIGRDAWDARLSGEVGLLEQFVTRGGRVLILDQRPERFAAHWLPGGVRLSIAALDHADIMPGGRPWAQGMAINPERPTHDVFAGITRDDLFLWSDYTGWRETTKGVPAVYPVTRGFALTRPQELGRVAVLANYDHGLLGVGLAEFFLGRGTALLSGFDIIPRSGRDPVADRLLDNLVQYVADGAAHAARPVIASAITWGDYASEQGVVTGVHSGFLLNTVPTMPADLEAKYPLTIDDDGFWLAGGDAGGWNTRPAIQYVGRGRRPFGPYEFSSGGAYRLPEGSGPVGEGRAWWRVPAATRAIVTTVMNPSKVALEAEVTINGVVRRTPIDAGATITIETPLPPPAASADRSQPIMISMLLRGDRRLVLLTSAPL